MATFVGGVLQAFNRDFAAEAFLIAPDRERAGAGQRASQVQLAIEQFIHLLRSRPDIVHNHEHPALLAAAVAYRAVAGRPVRVVHTGHSHYLERRTLWKRLVFGWLVARCWAVTAVSEDTASRFENAMAPLPPVVRIIRGGARVKIRSRDDPAVAHFRAALGLTEGPVLCQVSALIFPPKVAGVIRLVEAFALVRAQFPAARLLIVGDGPRRAEVEAACARAGVADGVSITGYLADVSPALALTDVACHITFQDALPISILEAMHWGKAIVASRTGGIPEEITDGLDGILVGGDPRQIAAAIAGLLADPERARALGARAAATAHAKFTWERVAADFAAVYGLPDAASRASRGSG